jgi:hypothetical protein
VKERYVEGKKFRTKALELIAICDKIVNEYIAGGMMLTVRQIYYQLVSRGHIENTVQMYNNVQALLNDARLAGLIDWDAIEDRTRGILERGHWVSGAHMLKSAAASYHQDMWANQPCRPFVIVEKEALAGVLQQPCETYDVPLLPARGYPSASTLRELAKTRIMHATQDIVIFHLGDHDPSGMDMSRDLEERLSMFSRHRVHIDFRRIALNMDQIEEQHPPPNPAKTTDCRYEGYAAKFGEESWELDALAPEFIRNLIGDNISSLIDNELWEAKREEIEFVRAKLYETAENFGKETE